MPGWPKSYKEGLYPVEILVQLNAFSAIATLAKVLILCGVLWLIMNLITLAPVVYNKWNKLVHGDKSTFDNKEGLQYIGAKANQVRDDTPYQADSLAEQAAAAQQKATERTTFLSRQGLANKPEEELKKSFAS